jgi:DNA-binding HxlR family transcriptional regulator
VTFSEILHNNPGMTPRVLSMQWRDLREQGALERVANPSYKRSVHHRMTKWGTNIIPILTAFIQDRT